MYAKKIKTACSVDVEEEFSIPFCMDDIITICKEYSSLGSKIQDYIDVIIENGLEQSILSGKINQQYLPYIKSFLSAINKNPLFGDASLHAMECLTLIEAYEKNKKSNDSIIFCNACSSLNDIEAEYCFRCKCPLLK